MIPAHYTKNDLAEALAAVGLRRGDVVFSHSNVGFFGIPESGKDPDSVFKTIYGAFRQVIGEEGTLVVPAYTYSFCVMKPFDPDNTPSTCGLFTELVRLQPDARRSLDPIFSVAAIGRLSDELTRDAPAECFGPDSFWARFLEKDGIICNLNFDASSTFIHFVEKSLGVPYRYDKLFTGDLIVRGHRWKSSAIYSVQDLSNPSTVVAPEPFDQLARERGLAKSAPVGRGSVVAIRAADCFQLLRNQLQKEPWFLTKAIKTGAVPVLVKPTKPDQFKVSLPEHASMSEMAAALTPLPRDQVSDGYDAALNVLATQLPLNTYEYASGTRVGEQIVPEKWSCHRGTLETMSGKALLSYTDNPLHVASYSLPFHQVVSREELFQHLHTHPQLPHAVPYVSLIPDRGWGLCCSQNLKESLLDDQYEVTIETEFSYSSMKIGEVVIHGKNPRAVVICASLGHSAQFNAGLSGTVVGVQVMRELLGRDLQNTYRLWLIPDLMGCVAHLENILSTRSDASIIGVIFLSMLGLQNHPGLVLSSKEPSGLEQSLIEAIEQYDPEAWIASPSEGGSWNQREEMTFLKSLVPLSTLTRALPYRAPYAPYPEYNSDLDVPVATSTECLEESSALVLDLISRAEKAAVGNQRESNSSVPKRSQ